MDQQISGVTRSDYGLLEKDFEKCLLRLRQELNIAYWHLVIYKELSKSIGLYLHEINQSPTFWGLTIESHLLMSLLLLNRFFDNKPEHLSIRTLLASARDNPELFSRQRYEDRLKRLKRLDEWTARNHVNVTQQIIDSHLQKIKDMPISSMRSWRNQLIAHINKLSVTQEINIRSAYKIKIDAIETIINDLDGILNYYHGAFEDATWDKEIPIKNQTEHVLRLLTLGLDQQRINYGLPEHRKTQIIPGA